MNRSLLAIAVAVFAVFLPATAAAQILGPAGPYCCDIGPLASPPENQAFATCQLGSGSTCPNAHAAGGAPSPFFASLELNAENGCRPAQGFTVDLQEYRGQNDSFTPRGYCMTPTSQGPQQGGAYVCFDTTPAGNSDNCPFSTLINLSDSVALPVFLSYCLSATDIAHLPPATLAPTSCDSMGNCCYLPVQQFTHDPVQASTLISAGGFTSECTPKTCANSYPLCGGQVQDGCGGFLSCGCPSGQACNAKGNCQSTATAPALPSWAVVCLAVTLGAMAWFFSKRAGRVRA